MPLEENYELVEGEWGNFVFRKVQPEDWDRVIQHIKDHFLHDEPTSELLGYSEDYGNEMDILARRMLEDDLSFLVEEKDTGELASVRVTFRHTKETNFSDIELNSRAGKMIFRLVDEMEKMADLFNRYELEEYAEFFVASTDPRFRKQGIVTEMYIRCLQFLEAEGFKLAKSIFTSPFIRAAATKLGFEEVCRLDYETFEDEDGEPVFAPEDLTDEHFAAVMIKEL